MDGNKPVLLHSDLLPVELTNGNEGRTKNHHVANQRKQRILDVLTTSGRAREPFSVITGVVVTRVLGAGQKLWDESSILRGNWKEIEDALVDLGWWVDDGPKFIRWILGTQDATKREIGPTTLIRIYDATAFNLADLTPDLARAPKRARRASWRGFGEYEHPIW